MMISSFVNNNILFSQIVKNDIPDTCLEEHIRLDILSMIDGFTVIESIVDDYDEDGAKIILTCKNDFNDYSWNLNPAIDSHYKDIYSYYEYKYPKKKELIQTLMKEISTELKICTYVTLG